MTTRAGADSTFDPGLQHERTTLAWERTAIAVMVSGILLARHATQGPVVALSAIGIAQTAFGGALLVWAGWHHDDLHGRLQAGASVIHPWAAKALGRATIAFTTAGLGVAIVIGIWG